MIMVIFARNSQSWYPVLFKMIIKSPGLLPDDPKFLLSPEGESHPLIQNLSLTLAAWLVSRKIYLQKKYQKELSTLSQMPEEQGLSQIMNRYRECGLASVIESKLIPLVTV